MLLKQMKYFVAVVNCNSFTEAAEQMFISQSAISQQIKTLEEDLQVKLFRRDKRKFYLTPAGEYFYRKASVLLDEADRIRQETVRLSQEAIKKLQIGCVVSYGQDILNQTVSAFSESFQDVALEIRNGGYEEMFEYLNFGSADFVIAEQRGINDTLYGSNLICESKCYIQLSDRNKISHLSYVGMDELKEVPCILVGTQDECREEARYYREVLHFEGTFCYADSRAAANNLVSENRGFLLVQDVHLPSDKTQVPYSFLPLVEAGKQITRKYCVFWHKNKESEYTEVFTQILRGKHMDYIDHTC